MGLADEKYLSFSTFTKAGEAKPTPVWIADLGDGTMGFTTQGDSWKVRRLANDSRVELQPCSMKGEVSAGSAPVAATATVVRGPEAQRVRSAIKSKYGLSMTAIELMEKAKGLIGRGAGDQVGVVVTLDG